MLATGFQPVASFFHYHNDNTAGVHIMAQVIATRVPSSNGTYNVSKGGKKLGVVGLSTFPGSPDKWEARFAGVSTFHPTKVEAIKALSWMED